MMNHRKKKKKKSPISFSAASVCKCFEFTIIIGFVNFVLWFCNWFHCLQELGFLRNWLLCCAGNFFTNQLCYVSFLESLSVWYFFWCLFGLQFAACGHISCFWCVHQSMSDLSESHCPICRDPYVHFPAVCQKLHFLLKNIYPLAHNKRENQVLSEFFFLFAYSTFCMF